MSLRKLVHTAPDRLNLRYRNTREEFVRHVSAAAIVWIIPHPFDTMLLCTTYLPLHQHENLVWVAAISDSWISSRVESIASFSFYVASRCNVLPYSLPMSLANNITITIGKEQKGSDSRSGSNSQEHPSWITGHDLPNINSISCLATASAWWYCFDASGRG